MLFGPTAVKFYVNQNYGQKVKIIGLKISPRLKVYASRVEFNDLTLPNFGSQSGFVRAPSFSFRNFSDGKLSFELLTGPIYVDDLATFSSSETLISTEEFYTPKEVGFELQINQADIVNDLSIERFSAQGFLNLKSIKLRQIQFESQKISSNFDEEIYVHTVSGTSSEFDPRKSFGLSTIDFNLLFNNIHFKERDFYIDRAKITGDLASSDQDIKVALSGLNLRDRQIVSDIYLKWGYERLFPYTPRAISYEINDIYFFASELVPAMGKVKHLVGEVQIDNNEKINITAVGSLDNFEIISGSQFIANLSGGNFDLDVDFPNYLKEAKIKASLVFRVLATPPLELASSLSLKFRSENLFICTVIVCDLKELSLEYDFFAGDEHLTGLSKCEENDCSFARFEHIIRTSDTQKFFSDLLETRIFNPMALIFLQSQLQQGVKVGNGHEQLF